jgi:hypothetical protein
MWKVRSSASFWQRRHLVHACMAGHVCPVTIAIARCIMYYVLAVEMIIR